MHRRRILLFVIALLAAAGTTYGQTGFALRDGDRVVFYGDSITQQRLYTTFAEDFAVTRFPHRKIRFIHSGWGGDRVSGGGGGPIDLRLDRDVIAYKPTVVTIMLGMNDGGYRAFDQAIFDTYSRGYTHIVERLRQALPGVRLTLIQPSPYDDVTRAPGFEGGYNVVLVRYGKFLKELGERQGATVADLNTSVIAGLQKAKSLDADQALKMVPDRVHPGPAGHLLMAAALLHAWNAPAIVTAVTIDASGRRVSRQENARVTDLRADGGVSWTQVDEALPMPLDLMDPVVSLALRASDVIESLDQQPLVVTGLSAARYTLKIDDDEVGTFSRQQLAEGINLAVLPTPMVKQSQAVHALTVRHNDAHFTRWRQVEVPMQGSNLPHLRPALEALDALEEDLVKQQREAAQPRPHRFELVPQG